MNKLFGTTPASTLAHIDICLAALFDASTCGQTRTELGPVLRHQCVPQLGSTPGVAQLGEAYLANIPWVRLIEEPEKQKGLGISGNPTLFRTVWKSYPFPHSMEILPFSAQYGILPFSAQYELCLCSLRVPFCSKRLFSAHNENPAG